jgi:hypothetical protein
MAFKKGQSGNPRGKKPGTRHKATMAALELLEADLKAITRVCIDKAKGGDLGACKLILDKIIPKNRERAIDLQFPALAGAAEVPQALAATLEAVAQGRISPGEGQALAALLEIYRRSMEMTSLEARLEALEEKVSKGS